MLVNSAYDIQLASVTVATGPTLAHLPAPNFFWATAPAVDFKEVRGSLLQQHHTTTHLLPALSATVPYPLPDFQTTTARHTLPFRICAALSNYLTDIYLLQHLVRF